MELAAIVFWLASAQSFAEGVRLYDHVGSSTTYRRLFALGETGYSREVLVRELRALVTGLEFEVTAVAAPMVAPLAAPEPMPINTDHLTLRSLDDLRYQLKAVRDERSHLHPQLTGKGVGIAGRAALAFRIVELTDQEVKLKADEAHVLEHGRLPGRVASAEVADGGELRQRLTNLLSLRSKLKKNPARADDLVAAEAEIILIRSKLNS